MDDFGKGDIPNLPPGLVEPVAPVQILTVHKEGLIQQSDLIQGLPADEHKRAAHRVHVGNFILIQISQIIATEEPTVRKEFIESQYLR
ncbi:MAG: hypothetical protein MAGBODY4_01636 [Candidatus Marinimicrobia bacterium]|nr:hypothetical protein [Candidatus Neomarinimicrobiota bacterium]